MSATITRESDAVPLRPAETRQSLRDAQRHAAIPTDHIERPLLITSVDAEESFDWDRPFSRTSINVTAMRHQHRAHDIFARHGVVPVYLVDYPVAHQDEGRAPLRELLADGLCEIGAQLHPWVNPPFVEPLSKQNSYPGNLPPALERQKLFALTEEIQNAFAIAPQIYRAGRFGIGPHTAGILKELAYKVDTSVMPHWSFSAKGGPDFRGVSSSPFWIDGARDLLEIPVSSALVGRAARLDRTATGLFNNTAERFRLPAVMARLRLVERIKLTPEGITIGETKRLVRHMAALGHKVFVLTFHSPSLEPGNTPYVRSNEDLRRFLDWLEEFYFFFRTEIRGQPVSWQDAYRMLTYAGGKPAQAPCSSPEAGARVPSRTLVRARTDTDGDLPRSPPVAPAAKLADAAPSAAALLKPTILMLAFYYPPENAIGAVRPHRMARYLQRSGYPVSVIAANPPGPADLPSDAIRVPGPTARSRTVGLAGKLAWTIERFALPYADRLPWVPHAYAVAAASLRTNPRQVLLSTHPPVATHLSALALKLRFRVPWIADFRDPLSDNPFRNSRRAAILDPIVERTILANADAIVVSTDSVADLWRQRYPQWAGKIHLIWNGFDPADTVEPLPLSGRKRRSIVHAGTLYGPRTPRPLIESLNRLFESGAVAPDSIQLRLIGPVENAALDPAQPSIARFASFGGLHVTDRMVPKSAAQQEILEADYLLLLDMTRGQNAGIQLPAKIFDYIRASRPILAFASPGSTVERVLQRSGIRYVCIDPAAEPAKMDSQIASFLTEPLIQTGPGPEFWKEFDASNQTLSLIEIIRSISSGNDKY